MNIANGLTGIRFLMIPLFIYVFYSSLSNNMILATYIFILAGLTDVLDGYLARKFDIVTKWGQAMDPLADKLMQLTVLICFTEKDYIPFWVLLIIGIKELLMVMGAFILYCYKNNMVMPANRHGKIATVLMYVGIIAVVFELPFGRFFISVAVAATLFALYHYFLCFRQVHDKKFME